MATSEDEGMLVIPNVLFSKATTTIDGGWNITFSVNQEEAAKVAMLASLRDTSLTLKLTEYVDDLYGVAD